MFDWIGDAIDWIGKGISSMWDNTVGEVTTVIGDWIWETMFEWVFNLIFGAVSELFEFINESAADIFDMAWAGTFLSLFHQIAWMLFICGMIIAIFDTAISYESGQANIKNTCLNVLKGFMAANLVTVIPQRLYSFCTDLQSTFATDLLYSFTGESPYSLGEMALIAVSQLSTQATLFNLFFIIILGYCTVKVVFSNIKRGGILLCQIAVGSLYLFSVPRGFTDGFYGWIRQVIATCITAFLQTTILYLGLLTFTQHPLIAVGICLSANEVPRIAQMFGLDTSVHVNMMSVSHSVSMGAKAVGMLKGAAK